MLDAGRREDTFGVVEVLVRLERGCDQRSACRAGHCVAEWGKRCFWRHKSKLFAGNGLGGPNAATKPFCRDIIRRQSGGGDSIFRAAAAASGRDGQGGG